MRPFIVSVNQDFKMAEIQDNTNFIFQIVAFFVSGLPIEEIDKKKQDY